MKIGTIKSLHNIYELAKTSGHPDYNYSNKKITHAEYDDIASKMHHPSLFPDIIVLKISTNIHKYKALILTNINS